ncbi:MAG: flagellar filament capping protein FliD, partial [Deltaproteobacteria bacterium]|nr:flagellar filament capping protein FliD [Deltaproteobacteria bacterium]
GLQNNDVISFSGTDRSGGTVSGSYTISDITTDTVQGLLSAIEDAFSSNVAATIDTSGRIVLTEKNAGESQISLNITEPATRQLDFGTVDVTGGAGDGSQEGRYALGITATDDGSGHLVLRNDEYGDSSFTISQDTSDNNYDYIKYTTTGNTTDSTGGSVYITGSTTWDDIYGADVADNDTITISGTDRDGNALTPGSYSLTYDITDITTDTVGNLLTRIENVFGDAGNTTPTTVNAFIQDGKIYVEQTGTTGSSLITLTLAANKEGGGNLSLGDFDQNTERDLDLGLINGTVTGQDAAGTIGGESATGTGQVLKGDDGNVNTDGLSIEYTGTSNDTDAGTITVTLGIAELFERSLYTITDSIDGYLSYKQDSLENSINRFDDRIAEMETRLDQKTEMLINKYVAMEMALNTIQNQSQWLTGQINSLSSWGL